MASSSEYHGVVQGNVIKLDGSTAFPDGQEVKVIVEPCEPAAVELAPEERMRRAFGAWAEDAEQLDEYLRWNREQRGTDRREIGP